MDTAESHSSASPVASAVSVVPSISTTTRITTTAQPKATTVTARPAATTTTAAATGVKQARRITTYGRTFVKPIPSSVVQAINTNNAKPKQIPINQGKQILKISSSNVVPLPVSAAASIAKPINRVVVASASPPHITAATTANVSAAANRPIIVQQPNTAQTQYYQSKLELLKQQNSLLSDRVQNIRETNLILAEKNVILQNISVSLDTLAKRFAADDQFLQ